MPGLQTRGAPDGRDHCDIRHCRGGNATSSASDRLLDRVRNQRGSAAEIEAPAALPGRPVPSGDDPFILRSYEGTWAETGVQGVTFRQLFFDSESRRVTMLVRMAPGSVYPPHRHRSSEECLVLQGDLWVGNTMLRAGDHQRSEAGTLHGEQSSRGGCLLLVTASPDDEMHAP